MLQFLATTSDDVFKSMGDTANSDINPMHVVSVIAALIAVIVLLSIFSRNRGKMAAAPKAVNHAGRLTRELAKAMGLKRNELKRLKHLAERQEIVHPMVLLLCPSLLKAAAAKPNEQT